jgi:hypothetical protein
VSKEPALELGFIRHGNWVAAGALMTTRNFVGLEKTGRDGNELVIGTSDIGTFATCQSHRAMSAFRGNPECAGRPARSRWCKSITMKE